jgi:hypothetical protein
MGCRLYFKAFTAYRFYKVNLKVEKSEFDSPVVLAHPHVLEEKSVVVQHATPAIEEALVCIKSYGDTGILMPEISVTYKRITTLQIYT